MKARRLIYLEISQLRELLAATFKTAGERFDLLVDDLVSADIASLGEPLATGLTSEGSLACVAALMRLLSVSIERL